MQAVILAAGRGIRMGELTEHTPKPMLPLLGKPLLEWKLAMLPEAVNEVVIGVHYLHEQIEEYFGTQWNGRKIRYVFLEKIDGTGATLHRMREALDSRFLVTMGDDLYLEEDIRAMLKDELSVLGIETDEAERFGLLKKNEQGNLHSITERPHKETCGVVNTGAYMLDWRFFDYPLVRSSATEFGLPQTLALVGRDHPVRVRMARAWQPIGTPEDIVRGEEFLKKYRRAR